MNSAMSALAIKVRLLVSRVDLTGDAVSMALTVVTLVVVVVGLLGAGDFLTVFFAAEPAFLVAMEFPSFIVKL